MILTSLEDVINDPYESYLDAQVPIAKLKCYKKSVETFPLGLRTSVGNIKFFFQALDILLICFLIQFRIHAVQTIIHAIQADTDLFYLYEEQFVEPIIDN